MRVFVSSSGVSAANAQGAAKTGSNVLNRVSECLLIIYEMGFVFK